MRIVNKVVACVDQSHFADYAAWAVQRMHSPLEFLHIIDRQPDQDSDRKPIVSWLTYPFTSV